jgi:hypothetical protein
VLYFVSTRQWASTPPETEQGKYACEAERELGVRARARLRELVKAGDLDFAFVACACPLGTEGK